jgi:molybdenum cofactor cytidylyltransferase
MKLLADVGGRPLIDRTLGSLLDAGLTQVLLVCTGVDALRAVPLVRDPRIRVVVNADPDRGMFSSIQAGLVEAGASDPVIVLPADMPFVRASTVRSVLDEAAGGDAVIVPAVDGRRGHPVAIPARLSAALCGCAATMSLREALRALGVVPRIVDVDDPGILRDVDVPSDLRA